MDEKTMKLAKALSSILDAVVIEEDRRPIHGDEPSGILRLDQIEDETRPYLRSPIATALRVGVRDFGRVIARSMDCDQMLELLEEASGDDGYERNRKISIADHSWDGLVDVTGHSWAT